MILNMGTELRDGWIKGVSTLVGNTLEVPISRISKLNSSSTFYLQKGNVENSGSESVEVKKLFSVPPNVLDRKMWRLNSGVYNFSTDIDIVEIPSGIVGHIVFKKVLNINGILFKSVTYTKGFKGFLNGTIYVLSGTAYIEPGSIIGNFIITDTYTEII